MRCEDDRGRGPHVALMDTGWRARPAAGSSFWARSFSTRSGSVTQASARVSLASAPASVARQGLVFAGEEAMTGEPELAGAASCEAREALPGRHHPDNAKVTQRVATNETATSTTNRPLAFQALLNSDAAARSAISLSFPSSRAIKAGLCVLTSARKWCRRDKKGQGNREEGEVNTERLVHGSFSVFTLHLSLPVS